MKSCLTALMYLASRVCVGGRTYMDLFCRKFKLLLTVQQLRITVSTCKNITGRLVLCHKTRANSKMYSSSFNNSEHIVAREVCFWKCTYDRMIKLYRCFSFEYHLSKTCQLVIILVNTYYPANIDWVSMSWFL